MPSYIDLHNKGTLAEIRDSLLRKLKSCCLCPRQCRVDRTKDEIGFCGAGSRLRVSSCFLHYGEEPEIVGKGGSGTIFFSFCNLGCFYCQNYTLSHISEGHDIDPQTLAYEMIALQEQGAENINLVTPTHFIAQIIEALVIAVEKGLSIPLVYNCGGYEDSKILNLVKGIFDIYMPDIKYSNRLVANKFSQAPDYWEIAKQTLLEMYSQVRDLVVVDGLAKKGLLIRHLVLPNRLAGSFEILDFIKEKVSQDTYVNIMQQYYPCYDAYKYPEISRRISLDEHLEVIEYAKKIKLKRAFGGGNDEKSD